MVNTIQSKIKLDISNEILDKLNVRTRDIKFECGIIDKKTGEFVIDNDKKLCHVFVEYQKVEGDDMLKSGVFWNGKEYSRVVSSDLVGINLNGDVQGKAFVVGKESDAEVTANFKFKLGKLIGQKIDVKLIDNSARKKETDRIRQIVIDREVKKNKLSYKIVSVFVKKPLVELIKFIRTGVIIAQEFLLSMERKLNKI